MYKAPKRIGPTSPLVKPPGTTKYRCGFDCKGSGEGIAYWTSEKYYLNHITQVHSDLLTGLIMQKDMTLAQQREQAFADALVTRSYASAVTRPAAPTAAVEDAPDPEDVEEARKEQTTKAILEHFDADMREHREAAKKKVSKKASRQSVPSDAPGNTMTAADVFHWANQLASREDADEELKREVELANELFKRLSMRVLGK
jgi:hypothetical protein